MARYYTVFADMRTALYEARHRATVDGTSQTIFAPTGAKDGWYIVGPSLDAPDLVEGGATPVFSIQAHNPKRPMVDWENEARGLCDVITGLHAEIAQQSAQLRAADEEIKNLNRDQERLYNKLHDLILGAL